MRGRAFFLLPDVFPTYIFSFSVCLSLRAQVIAMIISLSNRQEMFLIVTNGLLLEAFDLVPSELTLIFTIFCLMISNFSEGILFIFHFAIACFEFRCNHCLLPIFISASTIECIKGNFTTNIIVRCFELYAVQTPGDFFPIIQTTKWTL